MAENSGISWTHNTQNFWMGCNKVAPECAHCYIDRSLIKLGREPWGEVCRTKTTWNAPWKWETDCLHNHYAKRVFTCSLSDFFHKEADPWRKGSMGNHQAHTPSGLACVDQAASTHQGAAS